MNPAFSAPQLRNFLSLFQRHAEKVRSSLNIRMGVFFFIQDNSSVKNGRMKFFRVMFPESPSLTFTSGFLVPRWMLLEKVSKPPQHKFITYLWDLAGFDFEFGGLDNLENPLGKIYDNLLYVFLLHTGIFYY